MKVIIFGATGLIGTNLSEYLSHHHPDWKIHAVSRSSQSSRLSALNLPNVSFVQGTITDPTSVLELCRDVDMIYCCIGFMPYSTRNWVKNWPIAAENLLAATRSDSSSRKKKLIWCDNLYMYGAGVNLKADGIRIPSNKTSKTGIRSYLHQLFQEHMKNYPGTLAVVGASDFFGPHVGANSFLGDTVAKKILVENSNTALAIGRVDVKHDFCYAPDFARALAVASVHPIAYDKFWIAPHSLKGMSLQEIGNRIAAKGGKPTPVKFTVLSPWMVYMLSPFVGFLSEMREMLPIWTSDYTVDDSDFCQAFEEKATSADEALDAFVGFYRDTGEHETKL